jgi:hypothetical protein
MTNENGPWKAGETCRVKTNLADCELFGYVLRDQDTAGETVHVNVKVRDGDMVPMTISRYAVVDRAGNRRPYI